MAIPVLVHYPTLADQYQEQFVDAICRYLQRHHFHPRFIDSYDASNGVNSAITEESRLQAIRRLLSETNGVICVAFRCTMLMPDRDYRYHPGPPVDGNWLTSPWVHIISAMTWQAGLPMLILRDSDLKDEGLLGGSVGLEIHLNPRLGGEQSARDVLASSEWSAIGMQWEQQVRTVARKKGEPEKLY